MGQPGARLEVADRRLADGVAAVVTVQPGGGADAVGDDRVGAPGWERLLLVTQVADPPHDQPVARVAGLCDLRHATWHIQDLDPVYFGDGSDHGATFLV